MTKKAINVSVRIDLLESARAHGINLSAVLESALRETLKQARQRQWREENRAAIAAYNDFVAQHGLYSSVSSPDSAHS